MSWTHVLASWPNLIDHLCGDFPHMDPAALVRFRGDRGRLETYLAQTHDLTVEEAADALEDWLTYTGKHLRAKAMAA